MSLRIFECPSCGEIFAEDTDEDLATCPACDEVNAYRIREVDSSDKVVRQEQTT